MGLEAKSREAVPVKVRYEVRANKVSMCPEVSSSREDGKGRAVPVVCRRGLWDEDRSGSWRRGV